MRVLDGLADLDEQFEPFLSGQFVLVAELGDLDAAASDFVGTVPAIGVVGAADTGAGPGSAFELDSGSSLVGAGADITDITFLIDRDIFNRPFTSKTDPNPGAFQ
jgi:hypothetical protein